MQMPLSRACLASPLLRPLWGSRLAMATAAAPAGKQQVPGQAKGGKVKKEKEEGERAPLAHACMHAWMQADTAAHTGVASVQVGTSIVTPAA